MDNIQDATAPMEGLAYYNLLPEQLSTQGYQDI